MEVLVTTLAIFYIIGAIITFCHVFVDLTLDTDRLCKMLLGTFVAIIAGILWPIAILIEIIWF